MVGFEYGRDHLMAKIWGRNEELDWMLMNLVGKWVGLFWDVN